MHEGPSLSNAQVQLKCRKFNQALLPQEYAKMDFLSPYGFFIAISILHVKKILSNYAHWHFCIYATSQFGRKLRGDYNKK